MKFAKKLLSVLLVVLMMVTMALPAMATEPPVTPQIIITLENVPEGHTYAAYQIFKGKLHGNILTEIVWGSGINDTNFLAELLKTSAAGTKYPLFEKDGANVFAGVNSAEGVAGRIAGWPYNESDIRKFADVAAEFLTNEAANATVASDATTCALNVTGAGTGYYLIKDISTGTPGANGEIIMDVEGATDYLLQVVGPTSVAIKSSKPTFTKMVNHTKEGTYAKFVDSEVSDAALANIKDNEGHIIAGKLNELATSNVVWFKLEATLPSLLNYYNQYHVKFEDIAPVGIVPISGSSSGNIYIQHESGHKTPLSTREVSIEEQTNGTNKITLDLGNIKTQLTGVTLNLNDTIVIKYAARVTPGFTKNSVTTYTILGNGTGADHGNKNVAKMIFSADMNETTATKFAEITDDAHVYTYQATFTKVDSATKAPLSGAEFVLYRNRSSSSSSSTELIPYYAVVNTEGWITDWTTNKDEATKLISANDGTFTVKGLDALSYHLEEIESPGGYKKMKEPVLFTINSGFNSTNHSLTSLKMTIDGTTVTSTETEVNNGLVTGNVNNTKGDVLPATGGMGTTVFYIAGAVLLLGSVAAFAAKKRNEEE